MRMRRKGEGVGLFIYGEGKVHEHSRRLAFGETGYFQETGFCKVCGGVQLQTIERKVSVDAHP